LNFYTFYFQFHKFYLNFSFLFLDGKFLFETSKEIFKIRSKEYRNILDSLGTKITKFAHEYGLEDFDKNCVYSFKKQYIDRNKKELGKMNIAFIICFQKETNIEMIYAFKKELQEHYAKSLSNLSPNKYLNIQKFNLNQNILLQYFEHHINLENMKEYNYDSDNLDLPNYWTSLAKEGIVMNKENSHLPKSVGFSFRYDQIVKCSGFNPETIKIHLQPKIQNLFKPNQCCVSYVIDNFTYCNSVMFCSNFSEKWKCNVEIQIFKASLYQQCMETHISNLNKDLNKFKGKIDLMKDFGFLEKAKHIFTLKEIIYGNFTQGLNEQTNLAKIVKPIKYVAKNYLQAFMVLLRPHCIMSFQGNKKSDEKEISITLNIFYFLN